MARIELWHGDICDLEVDAIVSAASVTLWMATGVGAAVKKRGGDSIELEAVRQAPAQLGSAVVTGAGQLLAKYVIHAVSLDRTRRTSAQAIQDALASAMARARELQIETIAIPALGTGVGRFPLDAAARIEIATIRAELERSPTIRIATFALRGEAAYAAFKMALNADRVAVTEHPQGAA